jgi:hypothetical protein
MGIVPEILHRGGRTDNMTLFHVPARWEPGVVV